MTGAIPPYLLLLLFGVILYSCYKVFSGVQSEHQKKLQYLGPLLLFVPGVLSKSGFLHLILLVACMALFILIFRSLPSS